MSVWSRGTEPRDLSSGFAASWRAELSRFVFLHPHVLSSRADRVVDRLLANGEPFFFRFACDVMPWKGEDVFGAVLIRSITGLIRSGLFRSRHSTFLKRQFPKPWVTAQQ